MQPRAPYETAPLRRPPAIWLDDEDEAATATSPLSLPPLQLALEETEHETAEPMEDFISSPPARRPAGLFVAEEEEESPLAQRPGGLFVAEEEEESPLAQRPGGLFVAEEEAESPPAQRPGGLFVAEEEAESPPARRPGGLFVATEEEPTREPSSAAIVRAATETKALDRLPWTAYADVIRALSPRASPTCRACPGGRAVSRDQGTVVFGCPNDQSILKRQTLLQAAKLHGRRSRHDLQLFAQACDTARRLNGLDRVKHNLVQTRECSYCGMGLPPAAGRRGRHG